MVPAAKAKATKGSRTDSDGSPEASRLLLRRKSSGPPGKAPRTSGLPGQVPASGPKAGASGPGAVAVARRPQDHSLLFQDVAMLPIQAKPSKGGPQGPPQGRGTGARAGRCRQGVAHSQDPQGGRVGGQPPPRPPGRALGAVGGMWGLWQWQDSAVTAPFVLAVNSEFSLLDWLSD